MLHKSFQLAPKPFLISRIDYSPSVIWIFPKNSTYPSGKLRTKITSPIAKSTSPGLSHTTFFACCWRMIPVQLFLWHLTHFSHETLSSRICPVLELHGCVAQVQGVKLDVLHRLMFQISYSFPAGSWETEAVRRGKNKSSEWRKKETWKVRLPFWLFLVLGCCHCCWRGKNVRDHNVRCFCPRVLVGDICRVVRLFNCRWYFLEKGLQGPPFYFFRLMGLIDTVPVEWRKLVPSFSLFFFFCYLFIYLSIYLFIYLFLVSCISLDLIYRRMCYVALIFFVKL